MLIRDFRVHIINFFADSNLWIFVAPEFNI
jgi:hypothetical protein